MNKHEHVINGEPCVICANRVTHTWTEKLVYITIRLTQLAEQLRLDMSGTEQKIPSEFTEAYERLGRYRGRLAFFQEALTAFLYECPPDRIPELRVAMQHVRSLFYQAYKNWRALSELLDAHYDYCDVIDQFHTEYTQRIDRIMERAGAR